MPIALQSLQKERLHKKNCIKKKCQDLAASSRVLPRPAQYLTNSIMIFSLTSPDHQMGCSAERLLCLLRTSSSKISVVELWALSNSLSLGLWWSLVSKSTSGCASRSFTRTTSLVFTAIMRAEFPLLSFTLGSAWLSPVRMCWYFSPRFFAAKNKAVLPDFDLRLTSMPGCLKSSMAKGLHFRGLRAPFMKAHIKPLLPSSSTLLTSTSSFWRASLTPSKLPSQHNFQKSPPIADYYAVIDRDWLLSDCPCDPFQTQCWNTESGNPMTSSGCASQYCWRSYFVTHNVDVDVFPQNWEGMASYQISAGSKSYGVQGFIE